MKITAQKENNRVLKESFAEHGRREGKDRVLQREEGESFKEEISREFYREIRREF